MQEQNTVRVSVTCRPSWDCRRSVDSPALVSDFRGQLSGVNPGPMGFSTSPGCMVAVTLDSGRSDVNVNADPLGEGPK